MTKSDKSLESLCSKENKKKKQNKTKEKQKQNKKNKKHCSIYSCRHSHTQHSRFLQDHHLDYGSSYKYIHFRSIYTSQCS